MDKGERNKIIFEAAMEVFAKKGFADTRMADISKKAKMSYGLVYHYYKSKDEIFEAIIDDWWSSFYSRLDQIRESETTVYEKLEAIIKYLLDVYEKKPHQLLIYITEVSRGFLYHKVAHRKEKYLKLFQYIQDIIAEGQAEGNLRKDIRANYLTFMFLGSVDAFLSIMIFGKENITPARRKRIIESLTAVFLNGAGLQ